MSLSSDTEGPPPGPLHPSLSRRSNPDISEEEGEGDPTPCTNGIAHGGGQSDAAADCAAARTVAQSGAAAGLNYDSMKYTLVVDEHAQLELVDLKDCLHGYSQHEDSDTETVYQSANEDEDPEYEQQRRSGEEARRQGQAHGCCHSNHRSSSLKIRIWISNVT